MPYPDDETRTGIGDVLLVGGTFFLKGHLVTEKGISFPVDIHLKISRKGITFPKVTLAQYLQDGKIKPAE